METKQRSNAVVSTLVREGGVIVFGVKGAGTFEFDPKVVSTACRERALTHGFIQRISDGAAMSRNPENGAAATPEDKLARMKRIADHYMSGAIEWGMKASARVPQYDEAILGALAEVMGLERSVVLEKVLGQATAQGVTPQVYLAHAALKPKLAPVVLRIREEEAKGSKIEADEFLDSMD